MELATVPWRLVLGTLLLAWLLKWLTHRIRFIRAIEKLPGPRLDAPGWNYFFLGHIGRFLESLGTIPGYPEIPQMIPIYMGLCNEYKEGLFRLWLFHPYRLPFALGACFIYDPELVQQLLAKGPILKKHAHIYGVVKPLVGDSLLSSPENADWKLHRKLVAASFQQSLLHTVHELCLQMLDEKVFPSWKEGLKDFELSEWSSRLALDLIGQIAFSYAFGGLDHDPHSLYETYHTITVTLSKRTRSLPWMAYLPTSENRKFRKASKRLNDTVQKVIRRRQQEKEQPNDLLGHLLKSGMSSKHLFGNVRMMLFAGHDTTATVLTMALWHLGQNPDIQTRLQDEIDQAYQNGNPSQKDLAKLRLLDGVVKEALRMHAPAGVARTNTHEIVLQKSESGPVHRLPPGTGIYYFPAWTQTVDDLWEHPHTFQPERSHIGPAYAPFSVGSRNCVGQPVALVEVRALLAHLLRNYTVKAGSDTAPPIPCLILNIHPHEVKVDLERRCVS